MILFGFFKRVKEFIYFIYMLPISKQLWVCNNYYFFIPEQRVTLLNIMKLTEVYLGLLCFSAVSIVFRYQVPLNIHI